MPGRIAVSPRLEPEEQHAPTYIVPRERIVSIEHPCIVRNFDNGIESLGGEPQLKHALEHKVGDSLLNLEKPMEEPQLGLSLRPHDRFAKKLSSVGVQSRNVLIKATVPKRTGRKRKRGSDDPFVLHSQTDIPNNGSLTALDLLHSLKDNADDYQVEAIGTVNEIHRFRNLPDFQLGSSDNTTLRDIAKHARNPRYDSIKNLHIDMTPGAAHIGPLTAPPFFIGQAQPYSYAYQQAAGVSITTDAATGTIKTTNKQAPPKKVVIAIAADAPSVPSGPPSNLTSMTPFGSFVERCVADLSALLETRPIMTKRVAQNSLPNYSDTVFKEATQWVSYSFSSGPWRDTLIAYGVDPRSDPKYRIYQTLMFQLDRKAMGVHAAPSTSASKWNRSVRHLSDSSKSHEFTGKAVTNNGKTWQIIDIHDPLLARILATTTLPSTCDVHTNGWYHSGTIAKARTIMRDHMEFLFAGLEPPEEEYEAVALLPDAIGDEDVKGMVPDPSKGARVARLAAAVRGQARMNNKDSKRRVEMEREWRVLKGEIVEEGEGIEEGVRDVVEEEGVGAGAGGQMETVVEEDEG
ncbi:hypothetical protein B0A48_00493 [Cryoendolithus antarcticus]|uniref:Transcription factor IIIC subunit 5 HTH domain-containing protein n=1 Tax=Cryoendolithus antarcticus TaxID=1507870 RepID=A0A1V8TV06_9PEZI|nr:hypothetical protein B0A48_00493 [Cryoendolithus antarcticus]